MRLCRFNQVWYPAMLKLPISLLVPSILKSLATNTGHQAKNRKWIPQLDACHVLHSKKSALSSNALKSCQLPGPMSQRKGTICILRLDDFCNQTGEVFISNQVYVDLQQARVTSIDTYPNHSLCG